MRWIKNIGTTVVAIETANVRGRFHTVHDGFTIQFPSAFFFDRRKGSPTFGQLWLAAGQDGQVLRYDKLTGKVTGAIGTRKSTAPGYFSEAAYMGLNSKGHFYVGDSQVPRVTELVPPKRW